MGKQCFCKRQKNTKYLEGLKANSPKTHVQGFFVVPLVSSWSRIVFVYLVHCKSVTHLVFFTFGVLFFFVLVVVFRFLFPCLSLLCSLLLILLFFLSAFFVWPKKPDQITEYLKCSFWCSVLVPASSHFHLAQLRTPTRTREPPLKMVFDSFLWFLTMCWNTYFDSVSWTSTKISPNQNGP